MDKCAYCRVCPPAEAEEVCAHRDIRSCPRDGAVCGTCGARSAKCVGGVCKTKCTICEQIGHRKADCTQPKPGVRCTACNGVGHRSDSQRCPKRSEAAARTCTVCGSVDHVKGAACETLFQQWCKDNAPALQGTEVDARQLFEEAQRPKCTACGKPGHTAGTCTKPLPQAKVKKSSAEAVLSHAGISTEGLSLRQLRETAVAVVEQQRQQCRAAAERHNSSQRKRAERLKAFHRRAEAGRCYSRNRKLAAWQREHSQREHSQRQDSRPLPGDVAASADAAKKYRAAERELTELYDEHSDLTSEYNAYETRRMMTGSSAPASKRERRLLGMIGQVEQDIKVQEDRMRSYSPDNVRALQQQEDTARGQVNPPQSLTDADVEQMFPATEPDEYVTLSVRYYQKLLNGGAGRPADLEAQRLRYYTQQANNSLAHGAEHWPGDAAQDSRVLGTEFVPDQQPTFVAGFRVCPTGGTLQSRSAGSAMSVTAVTMQSLHARRELKPAANCLRFQRSSGVRVCTTNKTVVGSSTRTRHEPGWFETWRAKKI